MPGYCRDVKEFLHAYPRYLQVPTRCAAYRELPPQRGRLTCYDPPFARLHLPQCAKPCLSRYCTSASRARIPSEASLFAPRLPPSATPALQLSARQVSWAFCRLPALTSLEILFATYILVQVHIFAKAYRCLPTRSPQACHGLRSPVPLSPKSAAETAVGELSVQSLRVSLLRVLFYIMTKTKLTVRVGLAKPAK